MTYPLLWDVTRQEFTVSGLFEDGTEFELDGELAMIGHRSGDLNSDGQVDVADLTILVEFVFTAGSVPRVLETADTDGSCEIDISDVIYLIDFMFHGGAAPVHCP